MGILELIGVGISGILSGGATGLIGVGLQRLFDFLNKKQDLAIKKEEWEHEERMIEANAKVSAQEWAARTHVAQVEADGRRDVADAQAFGESFKLEPTRYSEGMAAPEGGAWAQFVKGAGWLLMVVLDAIRGIVRPGLTLYLCWIATQMYNESRAVLAIIDPATQSDTVVKVYAQIVFTLLYLFTTCVLWWFGTRNRGKPPG